LTLDALGDGLFKFSFNAIENPTGRYVELYNRVMTEAIKPIYNLFPILDLLPHRKKVKGLVNEFKGLLDDIVQQRRKELLEIKDKKKDTAFSDLLSMLLWDGISGKDSVSNKEIAVSLSVVAQIYLTSCLFRTTCLSFSSQDTIPLPMVIIATFHF
jgi:hypothetical protein